MFGDHFCWGDRTDATPARCCRDPPWGDPSCWGDLGQSFDVCCTRWLHPRMATQVHIPEVKGALDVCMKELELKDPSLLLQDSCSKSAYSVASPIGRLLWCTIRVGNVRSVLDVFLGSGCSAATALAAMNETPSPPLALVGFEDVETARARSARSALNTWQPRRLKTSSPLHLQAVASRIRSVGAVWLLSGGLRPNSTGCQQCASQWTIDCPERCSYEYGAIEAVCEGLKGVDLVFWDSDGSAADGWIIEWLSIERACAPRFVLLLNLSLPSHGAWIRDRLRALGYREVWWDVVIIHPGKGRA